MIKKIIHLSDIHLKTFKEHDIYRRQFDIFLDDAKNKMEGFKYDEIRFVITGDVAHQKINISNEQMMITGWLFSEITKIGKLVIIPGNHDFLENNTQRIDSITPVVELLNDPNISFYKDSGVYEDDNIKWVVYSLYQQNQRPNFKKNTDHLYVGLFHDPIQGMSTDMGFKFDDGYDRLLFNDLDLLLCGDIHRRQKFLLSNGGNAVMIGSLIQQNFGETVKYHGYGLYDVESNEYTFHDLKNEQPYLHFRITDIKDIENGKEQLLNLG